MNPFDLGPSKNWEQVARPEPLSGLIRHGFRGLHAAPVCALTSIGLQVFGTNPWLWFIPVGTMAPGLDGVKWETSEHVQNASAAGA